MNCSKDELTLVQNDTLQEIGNSHETYSFLHCLLPSELTDSNISSNKISVSSSSLEIGKHNRETNKNDEMKQYNGFLNLNTLSRDKKYPIQRKNDMPFKGNSYEIFKLTSIYSRIMKILNGGTKDINENTVQSKDSIPKRRNDIDIKESRSFFIKFFPKKTENNCGEIPPVRKTEKVKAKFLIKSNSLRLFSKEKKIKKVRFHKDFIECELNQRNYANYLLTVLKICVRNSALHKSSKYPKEVYRVRNFEEEGGSELGSKLDPH